LLEGRKILARREALGTAEARSTVDYGIEVGRGGCYMSLTAAQYRMLR
jgi:hypothetical protein